jgi:hypothetical protein
MAGGDRTTIRQHKAIFWSILLIHQNFMHKDKVPNPSPTAVYFSKTVKIEQRRETQRAGITTGRCAGPPLPRRFPQTTPARPAPALGSFP